MENIYIKETDKYSRFLLFLFCNLNIKKIIKKAEEKGENFNILNLPNPDKLRKKQKRKYIKNLNKYIKEKGIKNIYYNYNKIGFLHKEIFIENFNKIIDFFSKKKNIKLTDSEIVFIVNKPECAREFILKCYKKIKKFSVITSYPGAFEFLKDELLEKYGIFLNIAGNNEKVKKLNKIYINCEEENVLNKDYFVNANLIDIYNIYNKGYYNIEVFFKSDDDNFIKEKKIKKNLSFAAFYTESLKIKGFKEYEEIKIINIKNYDWQKHTFQL